MKIEYVTSGIINPNYIVQSKYEYYYTFWYFSDYKEVINCKDKNDIGVWRIKYKSVK